MRFGTRYVPPDTTTQHSSGGTLRKIMVLMFASAVVAVMSLVAASESGAATTTIDLSITGGSVAGFTHSGGFPKLPIAFAIKNNSSTTNADDIDFYFTWTNTATPQYNDYICPLTSNHTLINPSTPACEPGGLAAGKTTGAALMVTPKPGVTKVTVKACAFLLDSHTDPVSSNNCKTVTIFVP
jgi:hypothetical protein